MSAGTGRRLVINTSSLAAASFWRIFVSFVLQLLVARQLDVATLGFFALMWAWLQIAQVVGEAGIPQWLVREGAGKPALRMALLRHAMPLQVILSCIAALLLIALAWLLPDFMPPLLVVVFAALSLPFYAVMSASFALFESAEVFARVFIVDVANNGLMLLLSAALLFAGAPLWMLFAALVACQIFTAILALLFVRRMAPPSHANDEEIIQTPPLHWRTTLRSSAPFFAVTLADVLQQRADLLLLGALAAPEVTGMYAAATSIVRVVIKLVQAYWRALFPTLGRLLRQDVPSTQQAADANTIQGEHLHLLALRYALVITVGGALAVASVATPFVTLVFGAAYAPAGTILALLIWSAPFYVWEIASVTRLMAARQPGSAVRVTLTHLVLVFVLLPLLGGVWGGVGAALASVLAAAGGALVGYLLLRTRNRAAHVGVLLRIAASALGAAAAAGLTVWLLQGLTIPSVGRNALAMVIGLTTYALLLYSTRLLAAEDLSRLRRAIRVNKS